MTVMTAAVDCSKSSVADLHTTDGTPQHSIIVCELPISEREVVVTKSASRRTQPCFIAVITGLVVIAMMVAATLVGVYLLLDRTQTVQFHLEVTMTDKSSIKQETTHYVTDDVIEQHIVSDNGSDIWILSDFSRNIQIMKIQQDDPSVAHCYVTPLNRTNAVAMPSASSFINSTELVTGPVMKPISMPSIRYTPSENPITETSILGVRGQDLCSGISAFWALPFYDTNTQDVDTSAMSVTSPGSTVSRKRRQTAFDFSWCWVLQCQTLSIGNYHTQPRTFISCNRQYRCPCYIAENDASLTSLPSAIATTTPTTTPTTTTETTMTTTVGTASDSLSAAE